MIVDGHPGPQLTPRQQRVRDELLAPGGPRPTFPAELHRDLRERIQQGVGEVADGLATAGTHLYVNKHTLDRVHVCERHQRAEADLGFPGWTAARAKGVVAHQAVALGLFSQPPRPPRDLVDDAMAAYEAADDDWSPGRWLKEASPAEKAELRAAATGFVSMFDDCFPPLPAQWRPRVETTIAVPIVRDVITLAARPDLLLGRANGMEARCLVVDFKTGRESPSHYDDARYYALLVALRTGVPPYRSSSFYLESGEWSYVDITEDDLLVAARRVVDGVVKLGQLVLGEREPTATPGSACGFCCIRDSCDVAFAHRREDAIDAADDGDDAHVLAARTPF